jgi:hypothetical protein
MSPALLSPEEGLNDTAGYWLPPSSEATFFFGRMLGESPRPATAAPAVLGAGSHAGAAVEVGS